MATIFILAMTVTLFSVVFLAIERFPTPASPSLIQFSASITYVPGKTAISNISVTHLAGPLVNGASAAQLAFYIGSQANGKTYGPFLLSQGLKGGGTTWVYGQTWSCNKFCVGFPSLSAPDNVTVTVLAQNQVLFQETLQALFPGFAPYITQAVVTPKSGGMFSHSSQVKYWLNATIVCAVSCNATDPVVVNISEFQGGAVPPLILTCSPSNAAVENCTLLTSTYVSPSQPGTYFLFFVATDQLGRTDTVPVTVSVS